MRVTYYQLLEVQNTASQQDIKTAYKKLALIWHPDVAKKWASDNQLGNCENVFKRISTAYEILSDDNKKKQYDLLLKLPLTFEENQQEQEFNMQWETLKKTYTLYKERRQNPQTYIDYLQLQIIRVKDQSGELMSQIQKIEKDAEEFHTALHLHAIQNPHHRE